jgi:hypothetical protein
VKVRGLAVAVLAASGALAVPAAGSAALSSSTPMPRPGLMSATVFKVVVELARGHHAPHELAIEPIDRKRLPRGLAVVGTARLLVYSPRGAAAYVGIVAAYRSKTVRPSADLSDQVGWQVKGEELDGTEPVHVASRQFTEAPVGQWTGVDAPTVRDFEGAASALASNETFNDDYSTSWSRGRPPAETIDADAAIGSTEESLIDDQLDPGLIGDIEQALDARFARAFPDGSLDGDPSEQDVG